MAGLVNNLLILLLIFQSSCLGFKNPLSVFKRYKDTTRSLSSECLGNNRPVTSLGLTDFVLDIRMPGVTPKQLTSGLKPAWTLSITCYSSDVMYLLLLRITVYMKKIHIMKEFLGCCLFKLVCACPYCSLLCLI
uniref:Uncharacterized protein n=1 Tax=Chelonoidis abingdonii TaxID=106734 RepID=A0A8C0GAV4_CHEAB